MYYGRYHTGSSRHSGPLFSPQPGWRGQEYFQAYALKPDLNLYHHVLKSKYHIEGVGLREARRWYQRIYGSGDICTCSPLNIGHAAAYETYQIWSRNPSVSDPESDHGQRREAFIAIAIAEVFRIFYTDEAHHEPRKLQEACETAAATASIVFQALPDDGRPGGNRISNGPSLQPSSPLRDEFPDDNSVTHRSRGHSRRSSSASNSHLMPIPSVNGSPRQFPDDRSVTHESRSHSRRSSWTSNSYLTVNPSVDGSPHHSPDNRSGAHGSHSRSRRSSSASNSHSAINPSANNSPRQSVSSLPITINNFDGESSRDSGGSYHPGSSSRHVTTTYPQQYVGSVQGATNVGSAYAPNQQFLHPSTGSNQIYIHIQPPPVLLPVLFVQPTNFVYVPRS